MAISEIAYWGTFLIPLVLLAVGVSIQKLVDGKPFRRDHFYLGLDLTVYFLASTMINFLDIAKAEPVVVIKIAWTVVLLLVAIVLLMIQMSMHQRWMGTENNTRMQVFMLCYLANILALAALYGFVKLKTGGLI